MKRRKVLHVATKHASDLCAKNPGLFNTKQREVLRKKQMTGVLPDAASCITDGLVKIGLRGKTYKKIAIFKQKTFKRWYCGINISNIPYSSCK
jgi:hypothetical protein